MSADKTVTNLTPFMSFDPARYCIGSDHSLLDALKAISRSQIGSVFIVDEGQVLIGMLADGDVREALIGGAGLDENIKPYINRHFISVDESATRSSVVELMQNKDIAQIPVLDGAGRIVGLHLLKHMLRETETANGMIPLSQPFIRGKEWIYLKDCLDSEWISTAGRYVEKFESQCARYVGVPCAVSAASGTSALHLALLALRIAPGEEVLTNDLTFIAPVNAIRYVGATPVLMDVDACYWQLDVEKLRRFLETRCEWDGKQLINRASQRRVRAVLAVHLLGNSAPVVAIRALCDEYGLYLIEDVAQSFGASYSGRMLGSYGHIACTSFNGNKTITSGAGGMVFTDDQTLAERALYYSTQAKDLADEYVHSEVGYNYRMSNIHAAVGLAQIERIDSFIEKKRAIADYYHELFEDVAGVQLLREMPESRGVYWLFTIALETMRSSAEVKTLCEALAAEGIQARGLWSPTHTSPVYDSVEAFELKESKRLHACALSLPSSVSLSREDQRHVRDCLLRLLAAYRNEPAPIS